MLFLVDTSASMAQKCYLGTSLLDFAKAAVETFLKVNRCRRLGVVAVLVDGHQERANFKHNRFLLSAKGERSKCSRRPLHVDDV